MIGLSYMPGTGSGAGIIMAQALLWSTAVLVVAAVVVSFMRRASAASRATVWGVALAALIAVPLLAAGVPSWHVTVPSALVSGRPDEVQDSASGPVPTYGGDGASTSLSAGRPDHAREVDACPSSGGGLEEDVPGLRYRDEEGLTSSPSSSKEPQVACSGTDDRRAGVTGAALRPPEGRGPGSPGWVRTTVPIGAVLGLAWLAGTALMLGRFLLHRGRVSALSGRAEDVSDAAAWRTARDLAATLGIGRPVAILLSDEVSSPLSWGALRPIIVLPAEAERWPASRRRSVLLHELAHVVRLDYAFHVVAQVARAAYWTNPIVWLAIARYVAERERACDDVALSGGTPSSEYASHLVEVARDQVLGARSVAVAAMAQHSSLKERIRFVMDRRISRAPVTLRRLVVSGSVALLLAVPVASLDLNEDSEPWKMPWSNRGVEFDWSGSLSSGSRDLGWTWSDVPRSSELEKELTTSRNSDIRREAAWWLGEHEEGDAVAELLEALGDPDPDVRLVSAWALGEIKDSRSIPPLIWMLEDEDPFVREMAVLALGEIEHPGAVSPLMEIAASEPELARPVVWALGEIGDHKAESLRDRIIHEHGLRDRENDQVWAGELPRGNIHGVWKMLRMPEAEDLPEVLRQLQKGDDGERRDAALAIGFLGARDKIDTIEPLAPLLDALRDPAPEVRAMAVWALDEMNPSRSENRGRRR